MKPVTISERSRGWLRWSPLLVGPAVWGLHLIFSAAMVRLTCSNPELRWTLYAGTVVPALVVAASLVIAVVTVRDAAGADFEGDDPDAQLSFLGHLGVVIAAISILLIVAEGVVVPFLSSCA